jgi:tagatose 1,6-diphosphate aldolase GatY/KbaY
MVVPLRELLRNARETRSAVGAFTCYTLETAIGVIEAAEAQQAPVILLVSESSFAQPSGELLMSALRSVAERAPVPAAVQLDHVDNLEMIERAFAAGACAVMADGSRLPFDGNLAFTRAAVELADAVDGDVEAELGRIEGDEDIAALADTGALTDPAEAAGFVAGTGVACLAVSIGNVHGRYARPPVLDWPRLSSVRAAVAVPLSLHGASGLPDSDIHRAVAEGITKVNVNTELRSRIFEVLVEDATRLQPDARLLELVRHLQDSVAEVAAAKLKLFRHQPETAPHTVQSREASEEELI